MLVAESFGLPEDQVREDSVLLDLAKAKYPPYEGPVIQIGDQHFVDGFYGAVTGLDVMRLTEDLEEEFRVDLEEAAEDVGVQNLTIADVVEIIDSGDFPKP